MSLNRLNYNIQKDQTTNKQMIGQYQEHCSKMEKYVDFKIANPYSEKDCEYETDPTPKASRIREIKENYFKRVRGNVKIKVHKEEGRIIKPNIEI